MNSKKVKLIVRSTVVIGFTSMALLAMPSHALFGGGGGVGGASEFTQLMNKAELITTASNSIETARNTLEGVNAMRDQLRQLPGELSNLIVGDAASSMRDLLGLYDGFKSAGDAYKNLSNMAIRDINAVKELKTTPEAYMLMRATLAKSRGDVFQASMEADQAILNNASKSLDDLNKKIGASKNINSQVGGLQAIVQSNIQMNATLQATLQSMAKANFIASQNQQRQAVSEEAIAKYQAAITKAVREAPAITMTLPDASKIGESNKPVSN